MKRLVLAMCAVGIFFMYGCATVAKMPIGPGSSDVDISQKSILVAKVTIKNQKKPSHQPKMICAMTKKGEEFFSFTEPTLVSENEDDGKTYFASLNVDPGKVTLQSFRFTRTIPLLLSAFAELPFELELDVPANKIFYLGEITAVIKDKENDNEPSAGPMIPLIDQAITGFSTGKFEVAIADRYDRDIFELRQLYPYLKNKQIDKMVLPPWVHPKLRGGEALAQQNGGNDN